VVENVLLFVPVGLFLGMLVPRWPWWRAGLVAAGTSIALEGAQYVLATGASDVTDVLGNSAGALAGLGLLALARRRLGDPTGRVLTRCAVAGTASALILATALVTSPLHLTPQDTGIGLESPVRTP
jgi:glycopeptide antibiotics resistance protein